jgi:hypothetical protein
MVSDRISTLTPSLTSTALSINPPPTEMTPAVSSSLSYKSKSHPSEFIDSPITHPGIMPSLWATTNPKGRTISKILTASIFL